jgi:hypothetical protein
VEIVAQLTVARQNKSQFHILLQEGFCFPWEEITLSENAANDFVNCKEGIH